MNDKKVVFNFFQADTIIQSMSDFFNIEQEQIKSFMEYNGDKEAKIMAKEFLQKFNITDESNFNFNNCYIKLKHITTCHDNLESIKKFGLKDLVFSLKQDDSELRNFFKKRNIDIIYEEKKLIICGKEYELKDKYPQNYSNDLDNTRDLEILHNKIYYYNGEIETFFRETDDRMKEYSDIQHAPEILTSIDNILRDLHKDIYLVSDWYKHKGFQGFILEFDLPITKLTYGHHLLTNCFETLQGCKNNGYAGISLGTEIKFDMLKISNL